jgi:hypothetical protein
VTVRGTKLRVLQDNVRRWRSYCRKQRFCRISFLDRLAHYRKKELLQKVSFASHLAFNFLLPRKSDQPLLLNCQCQSKRGQLLAFVARFHIFPLHFR